MINEQEWTREGPGSLYTASDDTSPAIQLQALVLEALGHPCPSCSQAVTLVLDRPHDRSAFSIAAGSLGISSRRGLERRMRKHGFPPLGRLQDWLRTLSLINGFERFGYSLQRQAFAAACEPAVLARAVHRATSLSWAEARSQGLRLWLCRFQKEVMTGVVCRRHGDVPK